MNGVDKAAWERLSPLLDEFLDLPEHERGPRLAALRVDEPTLGDALAGMLGRLPEIERGFLEAPAMTPSPGLAGQTVGAYTLARELGHGGMGTVWLAHRTDGRYQGEVAIKFLRSGLFGHGDAARFAREGSILARLSHPHIARLLDAGVTGDGTQPYLVLEYIDGAPIDDYCRRLGLTTAARLTLFLDVLAAVAHAHNRLILHRDLKPSNILVTAAGEVKLLDFGIAKLLDDTGQAGPTELTAHAGNAFTPQFAAPEQLQGGDVTTATDVYALGVLMYMLLGGSHPTVAHTDSTLDRMRAVIELEPKRLSESVLRRGGPTAAWSAASRKLAHELQGDVDTIVARALKKSPSQRYANAADLADDIRRYLAHEPIAARPDTRLYRLAKFVRRHRTGVATASVAIAALGVGVGVALWQAREAQAQRVQAEGLIEFMLGDLRKKLEPVGRLDVLDGVGAKVLAYYGAQDLRHLDADSLGRRARALHMIGALAEQRGKLDEAERDFQQAADTTTRLLDQHPNDGRRLFDASQSEYWLGYIQWRRGRLREADAAFRRYYALTARMTTVDPANFDWRLEKIYAAQDVATVLIDLGRSAEALAISNEARKSMDDIVRTHPDERVDAGTVVGWVARAEEDLGHYDQAIAAENDKIALARAAPGGDSNEDAQYLIANGHIELARLNAETGRPDDARQAATTATAEYEKLVTRDPSNLDWLCELQSVRLALVDVLASRGDLAGARAVFAQTVAPVARLLATPVPKRNWRIAVAGLAAVLREHLARTPDETAAAGRALDDFLADVQRFEAGGGALPMSDLRVIGGAHLARGDLFAAQGRAEAARTEWRRAVTRLSPAVEQGNTADILLTAQADFRLGDAQGARTLADSLMATRYRPPALADLLTNLASAQKAGAPGP